MSGPCRRSAWITVERGVDGDRFTPVTLATGGILSSKRQKKLFCPGEEAAFRLLVDRNTGGPSQSCYLTRLEVFL